MLRIGITGCIGSGKTTVSEIFMQLGVPVYIADLRAKDLMVSSPDLVAEIKNIFGVESYSDHGSLNRKFISKLAFKDRNLLEKLNTLVHPAVNKDFSEWCELNSHKPYVIKEAALMFESDSYKQVDQVIVVTAPENLRIERTMKRDKISKEEVLLRMKNQLTQEEKLARGNFEIKNDEVELVIPQVLKLHKIFSVK
ncbi:MAG: dephospho-CoA kinase [Bacteroidia bacterium]